ncbi:type II toxin-antitoxin system RelE/ParE family toxin [Brevibacterium permense]|uniref:type II toxin-antitoxin system RelE/ParE family toxin n=1 Tax=Brevibacterium permense TaxID=234834 RepID=UPI0015664AAD
MVEWTIEVSREVEKWLESLSDNDFRIADRHLKNLAEHGTELGMPRSRSLGGGLHELRFQCQNVERRITYTFDPGRRVITLTTFRKQRSSEQKQVARARLALRRWRRK